MPRAHLARLAAIFSAALHTACALDFEARGLLDAGTRDASPDVSDAAIDAGAIEDAATIEDAAIDAGAGEDAAVEDARDRDAELEDADAPDQGTDRDPGDAQVFDAMIDQPHDDFDP